MKLWFFIHNTEVELHVFAKPKAKKTCLLTVNDQGLHIALHANPHQGEANKELIIYLAKILKVPKSQIVLKRGESSRYKTVMVPLTQSVQKFLDNHLCPIK